MAVEQQSLVPTQKLIVSGLAGSIVTVGVWAVKEFASIEIPAEIAAQLAVIVSFIAGYLIPPNNRDQIQTTQP